MLYDPKTLQPVTFKLKDFLFFEAVLPKGKYKYSWRNQVEEIGLRSGGAGIYEAPLKKHQEEKAWDKCCGQCACRRYPKDGSGLPADNFMTGLGVPVWQRGMSRMEAIGTDQRKNSVIIDQVMNGERPFYCVHQVDENGQNRVCGGWARKYGKPINE